MPDSPITRRSMMKITGAAAASALPITTAQAAETEAPASGIPNPIGVATLGFGKFTNAQLAEELAGNGIRMIQLFLTQSDSDFWRYNQSVDVSDLTPARCREIAGAYKSSGVEIHSVGVYANLIHPDPAERVRSLDYFDAMMEIAGHMGVRVLITEAGHHHPEKGPAPRVAHHFQEQVWKQMVATAKELVVRAESHGSTVLVEPFFRGFLASAKRTRLFLEEVGSPRLRALLDPANLLEVNDLNEMFDQLAPWIDCLHAKDRKLHVDQGVAAGRGDLDYPAFVKLAAERTPDAPLILEYVGPANYRQALAHLKDAAGEAN